MQPHLRNRFVFVKRPRYTYDNRECKIIVNKLQILKTSLKQWELVYIIGLNEKMNRNEQLTEPQKSKIRELEEKYLNKKRVFG